MELSGGGWRVMSFQLNYCIMLFVVVSSPALLHCTANVNLTNTRCALDYLRLDSPYCAVLLSHKQTHANFSLSFTQRVRGLCCRFPDWSGDKSLYALIEGGIIADAKLMVHVSQMLLSSKLMTIFWPEAQQVQGWMTIWQYPGHNFSINRMQKKVLCIIWPFSPPNHDLNITMNHQTMLWCDEGCIQGRPDNRAFYCRAFGRFSHICWPHLYMGVTDQACPMAAHNTAVSASSWLMSQCHYQLRRFYTMMPQNFSLLVDVSFFTFLCTSFVVSQL